jgi:plasmid maintenance system antidote protein VapI
MDEMTIRQAHLAEELGALDMSAAELARQIDVPTNRVTQILNGTRVITGRYRTAPRSFLWH